MIHLLKADALQGELPNPTRTGINPIFKARLLINGQSRRCFIKPLPDFIAAKGRKWENKEAVNEALGYVLASSCGFVVLDTAGIVVLNRDQIPEATLGHLDGVAIDEPQETFVCWFSEDMRYPDLVGHHLTGIASKDLEARIYRRISHDLRKREDLPDVVSFDEWLLNADRHPGNLLRASASKLALIDHGRIIINEYWQAAHLSKVPGTCDNRVIHCVEVTEPDWSKRLPNKSMRDLAYSGFTVSFFRKGGQTAARQALSALTLGSEEIDQVIDFLANRLDPVHYRNVIGILA